jgi:hypothetical protein
MKNMNPSHFVMRSDVKGYYDSINHYIRYNQFCDLVEDRTIRGIVWQYLKRTITINENYLDIERGSGPKSAGDYLRRWVRAWYQLPGRYFTCDAGKPGDKV